MQLPMNAVDRIKLRASIRDLKGDSRFIRIHAWIKEELHRLDVQNRIIGFENQESGAKTLADFDEIVTANQVPVVDREEQIEPGAESIMSAEAPIGPQIGAQVAKQSTDK